MRIETDKQTVHLTYCLNIHRGESWAENMAAIRDCACRVRDRVGSGAAFGLGLRLSDRASRELAEPSVLNEFHAFLQTENLYVFTINGFPYGQFHGVRVKENVYAPDWRTRERLDYTVRLARILARLLPPDMYGSISTVPGSYREWITCAADMDAVLAGLLHAAVALAEIRRETGKRIVLALEPEPDCCWDTAEQTMELFKHLLPDYAMRRGTEIVPDVDRLLQAVAEHLGVCLDTCHQAVIGEDVVETLRALVRNGVAVAKVQLSAAPVVDGGAAGVEVLREFIDPVYLHQSSLNDAGGWRRFPDLVPALAAANAVDCVCELRTHFHIPLSCSGYGSMRSSRAQLNDSFWRLLLSGVTAHLEVETYTFDVLPEAMRAGGVVANVAAELEWVKQKVDHALSAMY